MLWLAYVWLYFLFSFLRGVVAVFQAPSWKWLTGWKSSQGYTKQKTHLTIQPILSSRKLTTNKDDATEQVLNPAEIPSMFVETITFQLPTEDDTAITFYGIHVEEDSWYGTEQGGMGSIHLVRPKGSRHLEGLAVTNVGKVFTISTRPTDGSILVYDSEHPSSPIGQLQLGISHETVPGQHPTGNHRILQLSGPESSHGTIEVDLMILYTKRAMCAHSFVEYDNCETKGRQGEKNREAIEAEAKLNYLITNVALENSKSKVRFNLVHLGLDEFKYEENGYNYENFMPDMAGGDFEYLLEHLLIERNEAVHKLRNQVGADVVALIVDKNYQDYGIDSLNGKAGDVYDPQGVCKEGEESFDASTRTCPGRAYVAVSRNGRHHFLFTNEIAHILRGTGHNGVCNSVSNVAPYYAPCFATLLMRRGFCPSCKDPYGNSIVDDFTPKDDNVTDYSFGGTALVPRIPLFTGPGVAYSGYPLNQSGTCALSSSLTDVECFDFNGPKVAAFRKKMDPSRGIKLAFGFAFVAICAVIAGVLVKKRRQVRTEANVAVEEYATDGHYVPLLSLSSPLEE